MLNQIDELVDEYFRAILGVAAGLLLITAILASVTVWWKALLYAVGVWFVIDQVSRYYMMTNPGESYKDDQAERDGPNAYKREKEEDAIAIIEKIPVVGKLLVEGYEK